jgi:phosphinothricin acetyltransferase
VRLTTGGEDRNVIVTDVQVRAAVPADVPALTSLYNHYVEHTHITFDVERFTVEQRAEWFGHYACTGRHRLLVAVDAADTVLGYATSGTFRTKPAYVTSVETTVYVAADAVGRGVGRALYGGLLTALSDEDVHRAYAGVALPNDASLALHERFGFTEIGTFREVGRKFGRYWDVRWLERPMP